MAIDNNLMHEVYRRTAQQGKKYESPTDALNAALGTIGEFKNDAQARKEYFSRALPKIIQKSDRAEMNQAKECLIYYELKGLSDEQVVEKIKKLHPRWDEDHVTEYLKKLFAQSEIFDKMLAAAHRRFTEGQKKQARIR